MQFIVTVSQNTGDGFTIGERPARIMPNGFIGVVYRGRVWPLHTDSEPPSINLNDNPYDKADCPIYSEGHDLRFIDEQYDVSTEIDHYIEKNRFGTYLAIKSDEHTFELLKSRMLTEQIAFDRDGPSIRAADNGLFYDWYIRLVDEADIPSLMSLLTDPQTSTTQKNQQQDHVGSETSQDARPEDNDTYIEQLRIDFSETVERLLSSDSYLYFMTTNSFASELSFSNFMYDLIGSLEEQDELREIGNEKIQSLEYRNVQLFDEVNLYKKQKISAENNLKQEIKNRVLIRLKFEAYQNKYTEKAGNQEIFNLRKDFQDQINDANEIVKEYGSELKIYQNKILELNNKLISLEEEILSLKKIDKSQIFQKSKNWKMKMINAFLHSFENINFIRNDVSEDIIRWYKDVTNLFITLRMINDCKELYQIAGFKSVQTKKGWYETHVNEGESNRGRVYARFDAIAMKFDVDVGYKKDEKSQIRHINTL